MYTSETIIHQNKSFFEQFCHHQVKQGMLSELKHRHRKKTNLEGENLTIT
jgi:hypothetical protein